MTRHVINLLLVITMGVNLTQVQAQPTRYNHPELEWSTITTDHFVIHFHQGLDYVGRTVATIAEDDYPPITEFYQYEPDTRLHVILYDTDDYANGGAYYYNNKIYIWATNMDFSLRGTHNWLRNVFTHEFSHMIQLGSARKLPRWLPSIYLENISYEPEKREDVLYGYPSVIAAYPLPATLVPAWFAEGVAQIQKPGFGYDTWDTQRDMILREQVLSDNLLSFWEMESFNYTTIGNESVYNQGLAFVRWLTTEFGDSVLKDLSTDLARPPSFSMNRVLKRVTGESGLDLYDRWVEDARNDYNRRLEVIRANEVSGTQFSVEGDGNVIPSFVGDSLLFFISNGKADYLGLSSLFRIRRDSSDAEPEKVAGSVRGAYALLPAGEGGIFSRLSPPDKWGNHFRDLYLEYWDKKPIRLTRGGRTFDPALSPSGHEICLIVNAGGARQLARLTLPDISLDDAAKLSGKDRKKRFVATPVTVTEREEGVQYYTPVYIDDDRVLAARSFGQGRDIVEVQLSTGRVTPILESLFDERDPVIHPDGSGFYYATDRTGIYNIWFHPWNGADDYPVTNVTGGAFQPAVDQAGNLAFSVFVENGYQTHLLSEPVRLNPQHLRYDRDLADWYPEPTYDDRVPRDYDIEPESVDFEISYLVPRIAWDQGTFKPGLYAFTNDFKERMHLLIGGTAASKENYDLMGFSDINIGRSQAYLNMFFIGRNTDQVFDDVTRIIGEHEGEPVYDRMKLHYRFNLMEFAGGLRRRLNDRWEMDFGYARSTYGSLIEFPDGFVFRYKYLKGQNWHLQAQYEGRGDISIDGDISPRYGKSFLFRAELENSDFLDDFEITPSGILEELYKPYRFGVLHLSWQQFFPVPKTRRSGYGFTVQGETLTRSDVDDFFWRYLGGMDGMRGYSYYSLGGTSTLMGRVHLTFPIWRQINRRVLHMFPRKLFGQVYVAAGSAWTGPVSRANWLTEAGGELRMQMTSWGIMPTALTFGASYGFDEFDNAATTGYLHHGGEWRTYLKVLFDFKEVQRENSDYHPSARHRLSGGPGF